jgi:small subunit ribosomal protein S20
LPEIIAGAIRLVRLICPIDKKWLYFAAVQTSVAQTLVFANALRPVLGNFMANTAQARKRARQAVKQNAHNSSQRSTLRTAIKAVRKAIEAGDKAAASAVFQSSISTIDRIADKKIIHKNKAARHKSRLSAALKALA